MNETTVTVVGTVCSEVRYSQAPDATPMARFQIRHSARRFDRRTNTWSDSDPDYFSATCWRSLADHVASSMVVGDPVVATGRLRISRWRRGEENMVTAELDVQAIGHDLRWGTTVYRKSPPSGAARTAEPGRRSAEPMGRTKPADRPAIAADESATVPAAAATVDQPGAVAAVSSANGSEPASAETVSLPAAA